MATTRGTAGRSDGSGISRTAGRKPGVRSAAANLSVPEKRAKSVTLSEQFRAAILSAPLSRYEMSKRTGIPEATLSRFVNAKATLTLETLDRLNTVLAVEVKRKGAR